MVGVRFVFLGLVVGFVVGAPGGLSTHCNGVVTEIIVEDGSAAGQGLYMDDRSNLPTDFNVWLYLETNGNARLQSGGTTGLPGGTDPCKHGNPDLLLF